MTPKPSPANRADQAPSGRKNPLSRDRVLRAAFEVVDAHGPGALTMRKVAAELGVDPMAIYRHVDSKDAMLDGVVEMLWRQIPPPPRRSDTWPEQLRSFAFALRAAVNAHPNAARLLLTRNVIPISALEAFDTLLHNLRDAGFSETDASKILRAVNSSALGDALSALTYQALAPSGEPTADGEETDAWITLTQALPPGTPPQLVRTAYAICGCWEPDTDFSFVLDLILDGAHKLKRRPDPTSG